MGARDKMKTYLQLGLQQLERLEEVAGGSPGWLALAEVTDDMLLEIRVWARSATYGRAS